MHTLEVQKGFASPAHTAQTAPPAPQAAASVPATQAPPSQHPLGQVEALQVGWQMCDWHEFPAGQAVQDDPPAPQALSLVPGLQVVPAQHPLGQVAAEQLPPPPPVQVPFTHCVPVPHCWHRPPFVPQARDTLPMRHMVPLQQPVQFCRVHEAVRDFVQTPVMQSIPSQQLNCSSQRPPASLQPPSQWPSTQLPEQQCSLLEQVIQFGLQRQDPSAQYFVQQSLFFAHRLERAEPSPQGPEVSGRPVAACRFAPFAAVSRPAPPSITPSAAASPRRRVVPDCSARSAASNRC